MQTKSRRLISILLTLLMMAGMIAVAPVVAHAAYISVAIAQTDTVAQIQTKIQNAIDAVSSGDIVLVTGSKINADSTLALTIPTTVWLFWQAEYSGSGDISIDGTGLGGIFEVRAGGKIVSSNSNGTIRLQNGFGWQLKVTGGLVENTAGYPAISVPAVSYAIVSISSGLVKSSGTAIEFAGYNSPVFYPAGTLETGAYSPRGMTVELDSMIIPKSYIGTSLGLTIKGGSGSVDWSAYNRPVLNYRIDGSIYPGGSFDGFAAFGYTITLNPNGGSVSPTSVFAGNSSNYGVWPTPMRSGYTFVGWYTAASGGTHFGPPELLHLADDITLYARWNKSIFTTRYDSNFWNWILFFLCFGFIWMWF